MKTASPPSVDSSATDLEVHSGRTGELGASFDGGGTNFAVYSQVAERVELCLFDAAGRETRVDMPEVTGYVWHAYLPGIGPGQRYGYRVHGPWQPAAGLWCNPAKLLVDPRALAIEGGVRWDPAVRAFDPSDPDQPSTADSAPFVPRSVVVDRSFDWRGGRPPDHPEHHTIIYETHVRGFTMRHPEIPPPLRGTYAGLAHPAAIEHLRRLGVTAVELLPVHHFVHDDFLVARGLRNYWGYSSLGFFAPHDEYAAGGRGGPQVDEFKAMVRALHAADIEVILDVVYNHTAEGGQGGPSLSFRGLDNPTYYRLVPGDPRRYLDFTGTGNTMDAREPHVLQLIMDSLRYWITDMHVDGFRFDLAAALTREVSEVDHRSSFLAIIHQDPVIRSVKLIAEPWDVGEGGYQVGNFPPHWSEWNDRYRDTMRDLWRGEAGARADFGCRFTGSADLYARTGRRPYASVNFVTAHDGFTLTDLVTYEQKRNAANGEGNRDGAATNRSWNCGVEGPTDDPAVRELRARQRRNLLATLFLSQGVPMLLGGDEIGRTQLGNNNAYCQDNEVSWIDWEAADRDLLEFTRRLVHLRREAHAFHRRRWFASAPQAGCGGRDIVWYRADGREMEAADWHAPDADALGVYLSTEGLVDVRGQPVVGDPFFVAINPGPQASAVRLPPGTGVTAWHTLIDTYAEPSFLDDGPSHLAGSSIPVAAHAMVVLRREGPP
jgi:glycogen operon protein